MTSASLAKHSRYPLNQSPLFRLKSRKKLAKLLELTPSEMESLANASESERYRFFPLWIKNNVKPRHIERPVPALRKIQRRISRLMDRIEPPGYIQSAFRGRSYLRNAEKHRFDQESAKIDIRQFFLSAQCARVSRAFREQFECSPDVAAILEKFTTVRGHIPTGGNSSTMISFWAYKPMLDEIYGMAAKIGAVMTCCVDDMTFTGPKVTVEFMNEVRLVIRSYGLGAHKRPRFKAGTPKIVTGVAITAKGIKLPNIRRLRLHRTFMDVRGEKNLSLKVRKARRLLGMATEAEQLESRFRWAVKRAARMLTKAIDVAVAAGADIRPRRKRPIPAVVHVPASVLSPAAGTEPA